MAEPDEINVRKTHPNLYWFLVLLAGGGVALGLNFILLQPTFLIFDAPNVLWGAIFMVISIARIIALRVRRLRWVRATMAASAAYMGFLAIGTGQPFWEGTGSLQLPIIYALVAVIQVPLLFEPFVNPVTARLEQ